MKRESKIEIPKKYKEQLFKRFDINNSYYGMIKVACPLCARTNSFCDGCPLKKQHTTCDKLLRSWLKGIRGKEYIYIHIDEIYWALDNYKIARKVLARITECLKTKVRWI